MKRQSRWWPMPPVSNGPKSRWCKSIDEEEAVAADARQTRLPRQIKQYDLLVDTFLT